MSGLLYHLAQPQQKKSDYKEFDTLDFQLDVGEGRVLIKNSVRLVADLQIKDDSEATDRVVAAQVHMDPRTGAHALIDSVQVEMAGSQKENIQNYPRLVLMADTATKCPEDALNASEVMEMRGFDNATAQLYAQGRVSRNTGNKLPANGAGAAGAGDQDFAIKPLCCLNKMSGGDLPYSKSGTIKLSFNLAPNRSALMGADLNIAGGDEYIIRNPKVLYQSLPAPTSSKQTIMRTIYNTKNSIQSSFANVQVKAPVVCDAVSVSFQKIDEEQTAPFSNYKMTKPIDINRVEFNFNNAVNEYISYPIEDLGEMNQRFINSFVDTGHNRIAGDRKDNNQNFGVGLSLGSLVDLSDQTFGLQVTSGASNDHPYNVYQYFHGILAV